MNKDTTDSIKLAVQLISQFGQDCKPVEQRQQQLVALGGYIAHVAANAKDSHEAAAYVAYKAAFALMRIGYEMGSEAVGIDSDIWGGAFGELDY